MENRLSLHNFTCILIAILAVMRSFHCMSSKTAPAGIQRISNIEEDTITFEIFSVDCVHSWINQNTILTAPDPDGKNSYNESHDHRTCSMACLKLENEETAKLSFLKGAHCQCATASYSEFKSQSEDPSSCNIECPINESLPRTGFSCGGNLRYSVYCITIKNTNGCRRFQGSSLLEVDRTVKKESQIIKSMPVLEDYCARCSDSWSCIEENKISASFDYFPLNNAQDCVNFCDIHLEYPPYGNRRRSSYSILTWWKESVSGLTLPICRCVDFSARENFLATATSECTASCPGNPAETCGRREMVDSGAVYATVYCNDDDERNSSYGIRCHRNIETTTTTRPEPPTTTNLPSPSSTSGTSPETTEIAITPTPTPFSSTTVENTTHTTEASSGSGSSIIITVTAETTTIEGGSKSSSPTPSITTPITAPTPSMPGIPAILHCVAKDQYGNPWKVENGTVKHIPCSKLHKNSRGSAFWRCSPQGQFETKWPDTSNCRTRWLEEKHKEVEEIEHVDEAIGYIEDLAEACGNNGKINERLENKTYFGHEIKNMTILVNEALHRVRDALSLSNSTDWSKEFPIMVEKGINLDACLIYYKEPWKDLEVSGKSSVSTILIRNIEEKLFQLTNTFMKLKGNEMAWHFTPNPSLLGGDQHNIAEDQDPSSFLTTAEIMESKDNYRYEFPPKNMRREVGRGRGSYIKLPNGWKQFKTFKRFSSLEVAASSIHGKYVEYIMPGQYKFLTDDDESLTFLKENVVKVVNGRMISLTIEKAFMVNTTQRSSGLNERLQKSFSKNPVEIVFQHDFEAWEEQSYSISRKLHPGERPSAVKGSVQCVYWNTQSNLWSSSGCHLIRSTRYETVCQCTHLTSFAVLMDLHKYTGKNFGLELLTLILCPASEIGLIFTLIILLSVRNGPQKMRATISKNLSICLLIGNGLVLLVLDKNYFHMSERVCLGAGMVTHYVFLCAFMWMLIEGVHLYRIVAHAFSLGRSYTNQFYVIGYGLPIIIVGLTSTIGYLLGDRPYGTDYYCWLEGNYTWAFLGPVLVVMLVNLSILFIALKTGYRLQNRSQRMKVFPASDILSEKLKAYKSWMKGCLTLTFTLGLTWLVGFCALAIGTTTLVACYMFTILNASQGIFLFIITCTSYRDNYKYFTNRFKPAWLSSSSNSTSAAMGHIVKDIVTGNGKKGRERVKQ